MLKEGPKIGKKYRDFSEYLRHNKIPEWYNMYFDYDGLLKIVDEFKQNENEKFKGYYMFMIDSCKQFKQQVRYIPSDLDGWDQSDTLSGNEKYGNQDDDSKAWAVPFDNTRLYIKFKIQSIDKQITKYRRPGQTCTPEIGWIFGGV